MDITRKGISLMATMVFSYPPRSGGPYTTDVDSNIRGGC
jgi:hypothetical protein